MRQVAVALALGVLSCMTVPQPAPDLCDLREIFGHFEDRPFKAVGGDVVVTRIPKEPWMVPCRCEMDDWLRDIEAASPRVDAEEALATARPKIYFEPERSGIGDVYWGLVDDDYAVSDDLVLVTAMPFPEERWSCFEAVRLERVARYYSEEYNRLVMDGVRAR